MIRVNFFALLLVMKTTSACPSACRCFGFGGSWIADCARRNLTSIPNGFSENTTEIFLQFNDIKEVDKNAFSGLQQLRILYLQNNSITTVHEKAFEDFSSTLIHLTLSGNQISQLSSSMFAAMTSLKVLNLNNNFLTAILENTFQDLTGITQLSACNNSIEHIESNVLSNLSALRYAGFSHNNLKSIPPRFGQAANDLYVIDYANNALEELPEIPSNLTQIYLNENNITKIKTKALRNATTLYELFVTRNKIDAIESNAFEHSPMIGWLDLSKNDVDEVDENTFRHLVNLRGLNLTENKRLNEIHNYAFEPFSHSLTRLSFDKCNLLNLDPTVFKTLNNSNLFIWGGSNPWNCDCNFEAFSAYVRQNSKMFYDIKTMLCENPNHLKGKQVDNVTRTELLSSCSGNANTSSFNETALIISMSILAAIMLLAVILVIYLKVIRKASNAWVGSNETIVTASSK